MGVFNVLNFGATGNGVTDDTAAVQSALDAANSANGGIVYFPAGTYLLTSALTVYSRLSLRGDGDRVSILHQSGATAGGLHGVDVSFLDVRDLQLTGPGQRSGGAPGIWLTRSACATVYGITISNVYIKQFGDAGIALNRPIVSALHRVICENNGTHGFSLFNTGTSCQFTACYGNGNSRAGYYLNGMEYCQFSACAADSNGIGYELIGALGVSFDGCGAEGSASKGPGYDGTNWKINGGKGVALAGCFVYQNAARGYWVTGAARGVTMTACVEDNPAAGATASFQVDTGCQAALSSCVPVTPASLAAGSTSMLADSSGRLLATGAAASGAATLTDAGLIAVDAALGNTFRVILGGNRTLANPLNGADGQRIAIEVMQDAAGGRILSYGTAYTFSASLPSPTLSTAGGYRDILEFSYDASCELWRFVAFVKGFA